MGNLTPTFETYQELQTAFDFFNDALFNGEMPQCLITLQRDKRSLGYYSEERFIAFDGKTKIDEIAMNPAYFAVLSVENTLSTLVHEMVHLWQFHCGQPSRRGYHNKEWAAKMEQIGLMPSDTGQVGGKKVGQQMDHYIIDQGPFIIACQKLLTNDFRLSWFDRFTAVDPVASTQATKAAQPDVVDGVADDVNHAELVEKYSLNDLEETVIDALSLPDTKNKSNRAKYRCPQCEAQVWGKPGLAVLCGSEACGAARMEDVTE